MTPLKCIGLSSTKNTDRSSMVKSEAADPDDDDGVCLRNLCSTGDGSTWPNVEAALPSSDCETEGANSRTFWRSTKLSFSSVAWPPPPLKLGLLLEARLNSSFSGVEKEEEEDVNGGEAAETSENSTSCSVVADGMVLRVDVGGLNTSSLLWVVLVVVVVVVVVSSSGVGQFPR